jgi:hypothetical protein
MHWFKVETFEKQYSVNFKAKKCANALAEDGIFE